MKSLALVAILVIPRGLLAAVPSHGSWRRLFRAALDVLSISRLLRTLSTLRTIGQPFSLEGAKTLGAIAAVLACAFFIQLVFGGD